MSKNGLLIVFSGPSGAGKDTILRYLLDQNSNCKLSISATTRNPRAGEVSGVDYFFVSREDFLGMISGDRLLEFAEYCGNFYGTPKEPIEKWLSEGKDVILEIEVQGGAQIKEKCPDCVSIFILPPSIGVLEKRLRARGTEDEGTLQKRLKAAREEIQKAKDYDYVVVNDTVEGAAEQIDKIITAEKLKYSRNNTIIERVLDNA